MERYLLFMGLLLQNLRNFAMTRESRNIDAHTAGASYTEGSLGAVVKCLTTTSIISSVGYAGYGCYGCYGS